MLRNCTECWQVFQHPTSKLCPRCQRKTHEEYVAVRTHLRANPGASPAAEAHDLSMPLKTIRKLLDNDMVVFRGEG